MRLLPSGVRLPVRWTSARFADRPLRSVRLEVAPAFGQALAGAEAITVEAGGLSPTTLAFGPMNKPLAAMAACQDALLRAFGAEPSAMVPIGDAAERWFTPRDYPPAARFAGVDGRTVALLAIDTRGKVEECRVAEGSGNELLDWGTCRVAKLQGRFPPAGATGPARRWSMLAKRWVLW